MNKLVISLLPFAILLVFLIGCRKSNIIDSGLPKDGEGNEYDTVVIGAQVWLAENLKTTKYRDGRPIQLITDNTKWGETTLPSYCWYGNTQGSKELYGALYNWYAAKLDFLCPVGYHIPTIEEWRILIDYLGGEEVAGGKLKETGTTYWLSPNTGATNESGFSALPGGERNNDGNFRLLGSTGSWWTASYDANDDRYAYRVYINSGYTQIYISKFPKITGFSVRCIKNK